MVIIHVILLISLQNESMVAIKDQTLLERRLDQDLSVKLDR